MLAWLAPILVLGLVVFVHELGHFLAAKWAGVYAPRFALGFGPALWKRRRGETEYIIAALPLGGYVRMASKDDETMALVEGGTPEGHRAGEVEQGEAPRPADWDENAMVPFGPKPVPADRWFESKGLWPRLVIMLAGVTMNVLLTFTVSTGVFAYYGKSYVPAVIDSVVPGMPGAAAGLQKGDSIASIDGRPVRAWSELLTSVSQSADRPVEFGVVRGGQDVRLTITPVPQDGMNATTGAKVKVGRVGVFPKDQVQRDRLGVLESVGAGWTATWGMAASVVTVVKGLLSGAVSVKNLGGPVAIARTSVAAARTGFESLWALIAFLSVNLAVLNLLPIPILDGGQVVMVLAEAVMGKPISMRAREYVMRAGLAMIVALFAVVMFNDLVALVR